MNATETIKRSNQRLFDEALAHIRKQGCASIARDKNSVANCVYRTSDGRGCAFAPAIKEILPEYEGQDAAWFYDNDRIDLLHDWAQDADPEVALSIQTAHDRPRIDNTDEQFMKEFENNMEQVARTYDLKYFPRRQLTAPIDI